MKRRTFLATAAAMTLTAPLARASGMVEYSPGVIEDALAEGKTVFVDFAANWCSTCKRQERIINALRAENAAYDDAMLFVRVDWDRYGKREVARSRRIPRRSTLVLLKGDQELGRLVAETREARIRELMDKGLAANT